MNSYLNNNIFYTFVAIVVFSLIPDTTSDSDNNISTNSPLVLLENKGLNIICNYTNENDRQEITNWIWSKDGVEYKDFSEEDKQRITIDPNYKTLMISKANKNDIGDWYCDNGRGQKSRIVVRSKPWLHLFEEYQKTNYKSANVIEGERFYVRCEVMEDYNRDANVTWFKYNESEQGSDFPTLVKLPTGDPHVRLERKNASLEILTIDKVIPSDRFYYVCIAANGVTTTNSTILLRVKDKLGALWPFLGIVAEVVILCTIIFIYEKRRIKPDFDESDNENNTETKAAQDRSSKAQDVRQRK